MRDDFHLIRSRDTSTPEHPHPDMLFKARPCPSCNAVHGHSRWAVANSSYTRGLRCGRCSDIFYQAGIDVWLWSSLLLPITPFFLIHWSVGLLAIHE